MNERRIAYLKEEIADQEKIAFWRGERKAENYIRKLKCELSQLEAENEQAEQCMCYIPQS